MSNYIFTFYELQEDPVFGHSFHIHKLSKQSKGVIVKIEDSYVSSLSKISINSKKEEILAELSKLNVDEYSRCDQLLTQARMDFKNLSESWDIERTVKFLEIVTGKYITWFRENNIPITTEQPGKIVSKIDEEKEAIEKAVRYINDEIKKLDSEYIRTDIILI